MPRLSRFWLLRRAALAAFGFAVSGAAAQEAVILRAGTDQLNADVIHFIATKARAQTLDAADVESAAAKTPRQLIQRRCGMVHEAYFAALLQINALQPEQLDLDTPTGERVRTLSFPACLFAAAVDEGVPVVVGKADNAARIFTRLTGATAQANDLENFFGMPLAKLNTLQPGQVLYGAAQTTPTTVYPLLPKDQFLLELNQLLAHNAAAKVRRIDESQGRIVVAEPAGSAGASCAPVDAAFDVAATEQALRFALQRAQAPEHNLSPARADVVIVDNGFFGADLIANVAAPFAGSAFNIRYFQQDPNSRIARSLTVGHEIPPINRRGNTAIDQDSGHGTHVAGIVLGGPGFAAFRSAHESNPWLRLTILNIAEGRKTLLRGAEQTLATFLSNDSKYSDAIVNMSIAYDGKASPDIGATFRGLFRKSQNSVFVVAAGNDRGVNPADKSIIPASLGGVTASNVISVAALDGRGRLAGFSNRGASSVDLAAPGCGIESWLDNSSAVARLDGTSQAAPIVTFAASLLRHVVPEAEPGQLKARLVASGNLLVERADQDQLAFRVSLDVAKALFLFDDYVQVDGPDGGSYLGEVTRLDGIRCKNDRADSSKDLNVVWSLKRDAERLWLYEGRNNEKMFAPCETDDFSAATLEFTASFRIVDGAIEPAGPVALFDEPLAMGRIREVVLRSF